MVRIFNVKLVFIVFALALPFWAILFYDTRAYFRNQPEVLSDVQGVAAFCVAAGLNLLGIIVGTKCLLQIRTRARVLALALNILSPLVSLLSVRRRMIQW